MHRRSFLLYAAATSALPALGLPSFARAAAQQYTPGLVQQHLAEGKTVLVDFTASWCSTCASQARTLASLKSENPAYEENIVFVDVDWDQYGSGELSKSLKIPRRSTLVVLKGDQELGRIVAQTGKSAIKSLMDTALSAATTS